MLDPDASGKFQTPNISDTTSGSNPRRETGISSVEHSHPIVRYCPQFFVRELNMRSTMSHSRHFARDYNFRPLQCQIPSFPCEIAISGPNNIRSHDFRARLQYQAPTMSDPTLFIGSYNIRPRQCQIPRFSYEIIRLRLGYGRPHPTRFLRDYNVRPPDYFDAKLQ